MRGVAGANDGCKPAWESKYPWEIVAIFRFASLRRG